MNTRLGLIGVLLVLCGIGLLAWSWSARERQAPSGEGARPTGEVAQPSPQETGGDLRVPATAPQPAGESELAAELEAETAPAQAGEIPLLQQSEADWMLEFADASREDMERAREVLLDRLAEDSKVTFKVRLAEGRFETLPADAPPPAAPDDPEGLIHSRKDAGDGKVQQVVVYPHEEPELYALRSKANWLERRIAGLGDG